METPGAYPELTVTENLKVMARLKNLPAASVDDVVAQLGLLSYAGRRARDLSLGNQQRLGLAKALLGQPKLLVLDEPANGLDPAGVTEIRQLLKSLAAHGTAILLSSHILAEVARLATRIGIIHEGKLITEFTAHDLAGKVRRHLEIRCREHESAIRTLRAAGYEPSTSGSEMITVGGSRALETPDDIATLPVHAGYPPTHLAIHEEDLESLFLRLTGHEVEAA